MVHFEELEAQLVKIITKAQPGYLERFLKTAIVVAAIMGLIGTWELVRYSVVQSLTTTPTGLSDVSPRGRR